MSSCFVSNWSVSKSRNVLIKKFTWNTRTALPEGWIRQWCSIIWILGQLEARHVASWVWHDADGRPDCVTEKDEVHVAFSCYFPTFLFWYFYNLREVCRIFYPIDQDVLLKQVFEGKLLRWFAVFDENRWPKISAETSGGFLAWEDYSGFLRPRVTEKITEWFWWANDTTIKWKMGGRLECKKADINRTQTNHWRDHSSQCKPWNAWTEA